jgi:hypothetical protein
VFSSYGQLLPDDANDAADVYEYDAATDSLIRLSTGHNGQEDNGNAGTGDALVKVDDGTLEREMHSVSSDGQTVVFTSSRPLTSSAANGQPDAYEWHDGEVSLISGAGSSNSVQFPTISPSGQDIVFQTDQGLLPSDTDGLYDIYDARVNGGFPAAPAPPAGCSGDACQGPGPGASPLPTVGTVTFTGSGNQNPSGRPAGRAIVRTRTVRGRAFLLTVRVPGQGWITVSGSGIRRTSGFARRAGSYRIRVCLARSARRALSRKHRLKLRLRVLWAPPHAGSKTATFVITVRR